MKKSLVGILGMAICLSGSYANAGKAEFITNPDGSNPNPLNKNGYRWGSRDDKGNASSAKEKLADKCINQHINIHNDRDEDALFRHYVKAAAHYYPADRTGFPGPKETDVIMIDGVLHVVMNPAKLKNKPEQVFCNGNRADAKKHMPLMAEIYEVLDRRKAELKSGKVAGQNRMMPLEAETAEQSRLALEDQTRQAKEEQSCNEYACKFAEDAQRAETARLQKLEKDGDGERQESEGGRDQTRAILGDVQRDRDAEAQKLAALEDANRKAALELERKNMVDLAVKNNRDVKAQYDAGAMPLDAYHASLLGVKSDYSNVAPFYPDPQAAVKPENNGIDDAEFQVSHGMAYAALKDAEPGNRRTVEQYQSISRRVSELDQAMARLSEALKQ
jgi:hypothetical protein